MNTRIDSKKGYFYHIVPAKIIYLHTYLVTSYFLHIPTIVVSYKNTLAQSWEITQLKEEIGFLEIGKFFLINIKNRVDMQET